MDMVEQAGTGAPASVRLVRPEGLVALLEGGLDRVLLIDSRPFVDYNTSHILEAVNVNCSKLMKRRLQQDKVQIAELLQHSAKKKGLFHSRKQKGRRRGIRTSPEGCENILDQYLHGAFLENLSGFVEFSNLFPGLCEGKCMLVPSCISQPCLPLNSSGPTRILPHLYLGCQRDVLNRDLMQQNDIAYVLNASNTCPKPDFVPESHFLRVPVNDSFCEKILPWLDKSVEFIEKAKACNARVLVHCLAGISRSATIAIAYIMKRMDMSLDEAYRFVKEKRPTISPNFNFLGQLLDFEKKIKSSSEVAPKGKPVQTDLFDKPCPGQENECCAPCSSSGMGVERSNLAPLEPLTLPCVLAGVPEEQLLAQALCSLQLSEEMEDSMRLKRSFSLDIKSYGEPSIPAPLRTFTNGDGPDYYKPSPFKDPTVKACQFSPVEEVSEQSTPEQSPDKEQAEGHTTSSNKSIKSSHSSNPNQSNKSAALKPPPPPPACPQPLQRSGSMEETASAASFLLGLSRSQQQLAKTGLGTLKGWHSDILLAPVNGGWYLSSESARFYSTSAIFSSGGGGGAPQSGFTATYTCSQGLEAVRRRTRQRSSERGDSRRSWHEESTFEKQLKRRSCQMEFGEGMTESRSREDLGKVASQSSFSGSMEVIEVS
ncbi:dual specificity protein phosphatase 16 [Silurus meridionalis]|nr:dual specificity protein phosphatase 16 [Silurus meridionalis]